MDSLFFIAHTARARCDAGWFRLMGRTLRPLSALHLCLLRDQLGYEVLCGDEIDVFVLDVIAEICAATRPVCKFIAHESDADNAAEAARIATFDPEVERNAWRSYFFACSESRPELRHFTSGGGSVPEINVPVEMHCVTALLANTSGHTFEELWTGMPVAEMMWRYEAMREVRDGISHIATEPDPDEEPDDPIALALAGRVLSRHFAAVGAAKEMSEMNPEAGAAAWRAADAERDRLMALLREGRLADDLTEIPRKDGEA